MKRKTLTGVLENFKENFNNRNLVASDCSIDLHLISALKGTQFRCTRYTEINNLDCNNHYQIVYSFTGGQEKEEFYMVTFYGVSSVDEYDNDDIELREVLEISKVDRSIVYTINSIENDY